MSNTAPVKELLRPEAWARPVTVASAVARARREHADILRFGPDVDKSVREVAADAGPPDKIRLYLTCLADYGRARRNGPLGKSTMQWFRDRNISFSAETAAVRNSPAERVRRTWDDGMQRRYFEFHLKPAEAVPSDRCIRIYFDWDGDRNVVLVPYVGRHP